VVPEIAPGITLYNQAFVLDPSTLSGVNHTAGLRVRYGR
jgi:hypothetical protein